MVVLSALSWTRLVMWSQPSYSLKSTRVTPWGLSWSKASRLAKLEGVRCSSLLLKEIVKCLKCTSGPPKMTFSSILRRTKESASVWGSDMDYLWTGILKKEARPQPTLLGTNNLFQLKKTSRLTILKYGELITLFDYLLLLLQVQFLA